MVEGDSIHDWRGNKERSGDKWRRNNRVSGGISLDWVPALAERYRKLGGQITLIPRPGVGHHPHGPSDPTPVVDSIVTNSVAANAAR